jgi:hypothetical protein
MTSRSNKKADALVAHAAVSRRRFTKKLVGAAFAVPTMMSFALDEVAFGATGAQSSVSGPIFPTFISSLQQFNSSPAARFYCVPEDPSLRAWSPVHFSCVVATTGGY